MWKAVSGNAKMKPFSGEMAPAVSTTSTFRNWRVVMTDDGSGVLGASHVAMHLGEFEAFLIVRPWWRL